MKRTTVEHFLNALKKRPALTAAFNAFGIVINDEFHDQMEEFKAEFDKSSFYMAKRLEVNPEDFAIEWMSFANGHCLFFGQGY